MKVNKLKSMFKKESILIGGITALVIYQGCVIYNFKVIDKKINENVIEMDIPYEDFHSMPTLVTIIPEGINTQSYIVRGDSRRNAIAFEAYKGDKSICYFEGYRTNGTRENFIYTEERGVFLINVDKESIDNIQLNTEKPVIASSKHVKDIEKFIGVDSTESYIFAITKNKNVICYSIEDGKVTEHKINGKDFETIYGEISNLGEIMDYFFVTEYTLPDGNKAEGISITYFNDSTSVIEKTFYKYDNKENIFEEIELY